jgi:hypothetical protein
MDITTIDELRQFEEKEKAALENKKKEFMRILEAQKKEMLVRNEKELSQITSSKNAVIKNAEQKAKEEALSTIDFFKEKTEKLKSALSRKEDAIKVIYTEFLNQNV